MGFFCYPDAKSEEEREKEISIKNQQGLIEDAKKNIKIKEMHSERYTSEILVYSDLLAESREEIEKYKIVISEAEKIIKMYGFVTTGDQL